MKQLEIRELLESHELVARINEILHLIEEEGETIEIIDQGKVIAHVVPTNILQRDVDHELVKSLRELDELAAIIGSKWESDMDAVEAVGNVRRDL